MTELVEIFIERGDLAHLVVVICASFNIFLSISQQINHAGIVRPNFDIAARFDWLNP